MKAEKGRRILIIISTLLLLHTHHLNNVVSAFSFSPFQSRRSANKNPDQFDVVIIPRLSAVSKNDNTAKQEVVRDDNDAEQKIIITNRNKETFSLGLAGCVSSAILTGIINNGDFNAVASASAAVDAPTAKEAPQSVSVVAVDRSDSFDKKIIELNSKIEDIARRAEDFASQVEEANNGEDIYSPTIIVQNDDINTYENGAHAYEIEWSSEVAEGLVLLSVPVIFVMWVVSSVVSNVSSFIANRNGDGVVDNDDDKKHGELLTIDEVEDNTSSSINPAIPIIENGINDTKEGVTENYNERIDSTVLPSINANKDDASAFDEDEDSSDRVTTKPFTIYARGRGKDELKDNDNILPKMRLKNATRAKGIAEFDMVDKKPSRGNILQTKSKAITSVPNVALDDTPNIPSPRKVGDGDGALKTFSGPKASSSKASEGAIVSKDPLSNLKGKETPQSKMITKDIPLVKKADAVKGSEIEANVLSVPKASDKTDDKDDATIGKAIATACSLPLTEGMTAEEAESIRNARFSSEPSTNTQDKEVSQQITDGQTAEQAEEARIARLKAADEFWLKSLNNDANPKPSAQVISKEAKGKEVTPHLKAKKRVFAELSMPSKEGRTAEEAEAVRNARMAGEGGVLSPEDSVDFQEVRKGTAEQAEKSRNANLNAADESIKALKASLTKESAVGKKVNMKTVAADTRPILNQSRSQTTMPTSPASKSTILEPSNTCDGGLLPKNMKGMEKTSSKIGLDTIKSKESSSAVSDMLKGKGNVKKKGLSLVGQSFTPSTKYKGLGTLPEVPPKETPKVDKDLSFLKSKAPQPKAQPEDSTFIEKAASFIKEKGQQPKSAEGGGFLSMFGPMTSRREKEEEEAPSTDKGMYFGLSLPFLQPKKNRRSTLKGEAGATDDDIPYGLRVGKTKTTEPFIPKKIGNMAVESKTGGAGTTDDDIPYGLRVGKNKTTQPRNHTKMAEEPKTADSSLGASPPKIQSIKMKNSEKKGSVSFQALKSKQSALKRNGSTEKVHNSGENKEKKGMSMSVLSKKEIEAAESAVPLSLPLTEGMTAEEAESIRNARFDSASTSNILEKGVSQQVTEGQTAEQAEEARFARLKAADECWVTGDAKSKISGLGFSKKDKGTKVKPNRRG